MKKITLIIVLLLFSKLIAQNGNSTFSTPNINPQVPEANALFKYVDIPVSNNTGIPQISIPIYDIKLDDFSYPINLSYHSSGIRIDEIASSVGLGWTLNAGGMLTSQVNGRPDFDEDTSGATPYIISTNLLPQNRELDPIQSGFGNCSEILDSDYQLVKDLINYNRDTEPDIFQFSTAKLSGKFFYSNDGKANMIPFRPIEIIKNGSDYVITDENGTCYTFKDLGSKQTFYNTSSTFLLLNNNGHNIEKLHYLTKVETINKKSITFEYEDDFYKYEDPTVYSRYKRDHIITVGAGYYPLSVETRAEKTIIYKGKKLKKISWNTDNELVFNYANCNRLDLPQFSNHNPNEYLSGGFALKSIELKKANIIIETNNLNYDYFNHPNFVECITQSNNDSKNFYRLKLNSITKGDSSYNFEYYENFPMPGRLSDSFDNWGYFRSQGSRYEFDIKFQDGSNRTPELDHTKLGTLKKINYPTGGSSVFDYELNQVYERPKTIKEGFVSLNLDENELALLGGNPQNLTKTFTIPSNCISGSIRIIIYATTERELTTTNWSNVTLNDANNNYITLPPAANILTELNLLSGEYTLNLSGVYNGAAVIIRWFYEDELDYQNVDVGGLRIKEIKNFTDNNQMILSNKKSYDYNKISNNLVSSGKMLNKPRSTYSKLMLHRVCDQNIYTDVYSYFVQNSKNVLPLSGMQGYHIMYENVRLSDDSSYSNGYVDYTYLTNVLDDSQFTLMPLSPNTSYDFKRGDLLEESFYKKVGTSFNLQKKISYEYHYNFTESANSQYQLFTNATKPNEKHALGVVVSQTTPEICCLGHQTIAKTPALYDFSYYKLYSVWKYLNKKTTEENFNGNILKTEENYYYNNPTHAQLTSQTSTNSSTGETLETKYFYPHDLPSDPFANDMIANNMIGSPLKTETYKNGVKLSEQKTVFAKDATTNNLLLPKSIYTAKFPNNLPLIDGVGNLEKKVTYNSYDTKGNITQYTQENGIPVSIIWGYNKTQPVAKLENIAYSSIPAALITAIQTATDSATGTEAQVITALNALRTSTDANLQKAMITTYTHKPLIGVSTITDPKGDVTYYNYDVLNRLQSIIDKQGNILQKFCYNYKDQQTNCDDVFKSITKTGTFTRNNCNSGFTGSSVTYNVAAGKYESAISQADADSKAQADINSNGQNYANTNGTCTKNNTNEGSITNNSSNTISAGMMIIQANGNQQCSLAMPALAPGQTFRFSTSYSSPIFSNGTFALELYTASGITNSNYMNMASGSMSNNGYFSNMGWGWRATVTSTGAQYTLNINIK